MNLDFDVEEILAQLSNSEKISLLAGGDYWHTKSIPRLNIPSIRTSDGPNGIRGLRHFNSTPTAAIPVGTALASTWNKELIHQVGEFLDLEARAKGVHVLLGPTVNIQRIPNGGRGFESFSEDPYLSGQLAAEYIKGFQKNGLAAVLKHFVGNDQENERFSSNSIISQRALREIYLRPFEIAISQSSPKGVMTSYNKVNGIHASEDPYLIDTILRKEWKWDGLVMSDWTGTYSTTKALTAGLDIEMPGPGLWRGPRVAHALLAGKISQNVIDERARNVLKMVKAVSNSGVPEHAPETERNKPEDREFLRRVAGESIVLLKNNHNILPLKKQKTLVIGPNAIYSAFSGGGSALVTPYYTTSPIEGITNKLGEEFVEFSIGSYNHKYAPSLKNELYLDDGKTKGTLFKIFNDHPQEKSSEPFDTLILKDVNYFRMNDYVNPNLKSEKFYAELTSKFIPDFEGTYEFGIAVFGTASLYIDEELVVDNTTKQKAGESFYGLGTEEVTGVFKVTKNRSYNLKVIFGSGATSKLQSSNSGFYGGGGLRFGGYLQIEPSDAIKIAAQKASEFDQVILVTGLSKDWESEGADRLNIKLPPHNDELIEEVLKANENCSVVIQSGTPVELPWVHRCNALLYTSYGGDETGNAIADVLFGDIVPSGKLSLTFPIKFEDTPSFINNTTNDGSVVYGEDIYVGYRYFDKAQKPVSFPFGYGKSFTSFKLNDSNIIINGSTLEVSVEIENTGNYDGHEVLQLYIGSKNAAVQRPVKELKSFEKVFLKQKEKSTIRFELELFEATKYFNESKSEWVSDKGSYYVYIGSSSADEDAQVQWFSI